MLTFNGDFTARTCDGLSRRNFLQVGSLGIAGLTLLAGQVSVFAADRTVEWDFDQSSVWRISDGVVHANAPAGANTHLLVKMKSVADVLVQTDVRFSKTSPRHNFGVILRARGQNHFVLRYYDRPRALELLSFQGSDWQPVGKRSASIDVAADRWYTLKAVAVGQEVLAKLWPSDKAEPDWQLRVRVDDRDAGRHGLLVHDAGQVAFRNFKLSTQAVELSRLKKEIEVQHQQQLKELGDSLKLAVAPESFPRDTGKTRRIDVVPFAHADRFPVAGTLFWTVNDRKNRRDVTIDDYFGDTLRIDVPEPSKGAKIDVTLRTSDGIVLRNNAMIEPAELKPWRYYVRRSIDTLIAHGKDDYGAIKSPMLMAVLDLTTLRSPKKPKLLDSLIRSEERLHRRGERGSNLWHDQSLLRSMYRLTKLTGDTRYSAAADAYVDYTLKNTFRKNGLLSWGTHVFWDCYAERAGGDRNGAGPHEILVFEAEWQEMFRVNPAAVRREIDNLWTWHIYDKETGAHNRHDDKRKGCDFAFSGGSFILAFSFLYKETGEKHYLDKAKKVADWHWKNRNPKTGLVADCPGLTSRYDGNHCFTTVTGPHATMLLRSSEFSGDPYFRDIAVAYIKAYDRYGWNDKAKTYNAMLRLDGTPVGKRLGSKGYDRWAPFGPVIVWRSTSYSYEFSLSAAQSAIYAYEQSGDTEMLRTARRWAAIIQNSLPPHTSPSWKKALESALPESTGGVYAEDYGRAISFFVHLARATQEPSYLKQAEALAEEAVTKLFYNGLFRGHSGKNYYETTNGVGLLLYALLELDAPSKNLRGAF